jgi:hypothetical protein
MQDKVTQIQRNGSQLQSLNALMQSRQPGKRQAYEYFRFLIRQSECR